MNALKVNEHSSPMHAFSHIHARDRTNLISWKNKGLGALDSEIKSTEGKI